MSNDTVLYVIYRGEPSDRFDRAYYVTHHLPLVMDAFGPYGLQSVDAFYPAQHRAGTVAICECRFRDAAAIDAAFGSPEAVRVMADLSHFTDIVPARLRAEPL